MTIFFHILESYDNDTLKDFKSNSCQNPPAFRHFKPPTVFFFNQPEPEWLVHHCAFMNQIPLVFGCVKNKTTGMTAWLSVSNGGKKGFRENRLAGRAAGRSRCDVTWRLHGTVGGPRFSQRPAAVQRGSPIFQGVLKYVSNWWKPPTSMDFVSRCFPTAESQKEV